MTNLQKMALEKLNADSYEMSENKVFVLAVKGDEKFSIGKRGGVQIKISTGNYKTYKL